MPDRILIVADEADLASSVTAALPEYDAVVAEDASTALEYLGTFRPDLLVLDMGLAGESAPGLLEGISAGRFTRVPVLLVTGSSQMVDLAPYADAVAGMIARPFSLAALRQRIEAVLGGAGRGSRSAGAQPSVGYEVLVVEDDASLRQRLVRFLVQAGHRVEAVGTASAGISLLDRRRFDVVLTDYILPGTSGLEVLREARSASTETLVVLMTGYATPELIRRVLAMGAADVLIKPFALQTLPLVLEKCRQAARTADRTAGTAAVPIPRPPRERPRPRHSDGAARRYTFADILGESSAIVEAVQKARLVAPLDSTVLILGETGTGKEMFAQAIHGASGRSDGPFVAVNVAAIPETLVESELFGYSPGAFTGARREGYPGKLAAANGGTFFLDEIGDLPLPLQAKLLRVLEEGEVAPVGGSARRINVRFVAATHRNLSEMVRQGAFRSDLFYRLNVVMIHLPTLRERQVDIPGLAQHFLTDLRERYSGADRRFAGDTLEAMQHYAWPGNVRELHNAVEHAYALATGPVILPAHLPSWVLKAELAPDGGNGVPASQPDPRAAEREAILTALRESRGNKSRAAKLLGISRAGLYIKLKTHQLQ